MFHVEQLSRTDPQGIHPLQIPPMRRRGRDGATGGATLPRASPTKKFWEKKFVFLWKRKGRLKRLEREATGIKK
jgi:hypothetical protein